jgi:integrase
LDALIEALPDRYVAPVTTLGNVGLRFGELAALQPDDFQPLRRRLVITKSLTEVAGELIEGPTKNSKNREVAISNSVVGAIARHMQVYGVSDSGRLFSDDSGRPLRARAFLPRVFKPALAEAGLPSTVRVHELRHTAASLLAHQKVDLYKLSKHLGHSSIQVTIDIYAQMYPDDMDEIADAMDASADSSRTVRPESGVS